MAWPDGEPSRPPAPASVTLPDPLVETPPAGQAPPPAAGTARTGTPLRVSVPSVGLDAAVLPTRPADGELDPPTSSEAYWIEDYGTVGPWADNTAYIAGHSGARSPAVFDALFDRTRQVALVDVGDDVLVTAAEGRSTYRVTRLERYPKGELAQTDDVWRKAPGRLVLITCFQRPDGRASQDNLVVFAELVPAAA